MDTVYDKPGERTKTPDLLNKQDSGSVSAETRSNLLTMNKEATEDTVNGRYMIMDMQIQVGSWVPEAIWHFDNDVTVKAVMRASAPNDKGLRALKPAVLIVNHSIMK